MNPRRAWRAQRLIIETPEPGSEPWIELTLQQVFLGENGRPLSIVPRYDRVYRRAQDIFAETITLQDPLTQQQAILTATGVFLGIELLATPWIEQHTGGVRGTSGWIEEQI